ncbi:MAG: isoprenyl transferase [Deltaproteobacteria bacterium]|nr:isoprenyl transferase [Deltaproteobacteria bacterium]
MEVEKSNNHKDNKIPGHLGIIMDGNGRWAKAKGKIRIAGHKEGAKTVDKIVTACRIKGVRALTLYAFSSQNWERPTLEVTALMELLKEYLKNQRNKILDNNIKLNAIGEIERLPLKTKNELKRLINDSKNNDGMILTLALSYGGREEIIDASKKIAEKIKNNDLKIEDINVEIFTNETWSKDLGEVDLIIRTSGEVRLSNFMLWSSPYCELYFTKKMWPDFDEHDLDEAFKEFSSRKRKYGKIE